MNSNYHIEVINVDNIYVEFSYWLVKDIIHMRLQTKENVYIQYTFDTDGNLLSTLKDDRLYLDRIEISNIISFRNNLENICKEMTLIQSC